MFLLAKNTSSSLWAPAHDVSALIRHRLTTNCQVLKIQLCIIHIDKVQLFIIFIKQEYMYVYRHVYYVFQ